MEKAPSAFRQKEQSLVPSSSLIVAARRRVGEQQKVQSPAGAGPQGRGHRYGRRAGLDHK